MMAEPFYTMRHNHDIAASERLAGWSTMADHLLPCDAYERLAVLLTTEFEGLGQNGGVGTYYRELARALSGSGWTIILVILGGFLKVDSQSPPSNVDCLIDLVHVDELLLLTPLHLAMRAAVASDPNQLTGLNCLIFLQALAARYPEVPIFAEFHEMFGFGCLSAMARKVGLLGDNVSIGVTMHSGHEWIYEANRAILNRDNREFLRIANREEQSFFDATLPMYPSDSLNQIVCSYGWRTAHAKRLPYFVPVLDPAGDDQPPISRSLVPELIFFGRLEERKGLIEFIDAVLELAAIGTGSFCVTFLGKSIPLFSAHLPRTTSHAYIAQRLGGRVPFQVFSDRSSDDAIAYVKESTAAVVCLASPTDNFPNAALEMGQIPIPLVVSDTVGFHQTLSLVNRVDGLFWFEPGSVGSLQRQLHAALLALGDVPFRVASRAQLLQINRDLLCERLQLIDHSFLPNPSEKLEQECLIVDHGMSADASRAFHHALGEAKRLGKAYILSSLSGSVPGLSGQVELLQAAECARADLVLVSESLTTGVRCCDAVSIADILAVDYQPPGCILLRSGAFASLPLLTAGSVLQLHRQLLAAAIVTGAAVAMLPYPLIDRPAIPPTPTRMVEDTVDQVRLTRFLATIPPERYVARALFHLALSVQQAETAYRFLSPEDSLRRLLAKAPAYFALSGRLVIRRYRRSLRQWLDGLGRT